MYFNERYFFYIFVKITVQWEPCAIINCLGRTKEPGFLRINRVLAELLKSDGCYEERVMEFPRHFYVKSKKEVCFPLGCTICSNTNRRVILKLLVDKTLKFY